MPTRKLVVLPEPMPEPKREEVTWEMMPANDPMTRKMNLRLWLRGQVSYRWAPEYGRYVDMSQRSPVQKEMVRRGKVVRSMVES